MPEFIDSTAKASFETDPQVLIRLATEHPELRVTVCQNPSFPETLRKYREERGTTGADREMAAFLVKVPSLKQVTSSFNLPGALTPGAPVNSGGGRRPLLV